MRNPQRAHSGRTTKDEKGAGICARVVTAGSIRVRDTIETE